MSPAKELFLDAAERILDGRSGLACIAIHHAWLGSNIPRRVYTECQQLFKELYQPPPPPGYFYPLPTWWDDDDRESRIIALLLAAELV